MLAVGKWAETVLAETGAGRAASLEVVTVVRTLRQIAAAEGQGSQGRKLELLAGLLGQATPLEARYLLRLVTGNLRLGIGTPTILDALAQVYAGGRAQRKVLERGYNICCDIGLVASTLVSGGLVEHVAATGRYRLGVGVIRLASAVRDQYAHVAHTIIIGNDSTVGLKGIAPKAETTRSNARFPAARIPSRGRILASSSGRSPTMRNRRRPIIVSN